MSFLAPLFLLGGLAVALPVLFHLIRRTSREKTVFSSLMFLQPTPPRVTRRSRLEHVFLLLLRCLVLALLAAGFARPFLQKDSAAGAAAGQGRKILVLVDTSASMRRGDLWPQARARAGEVLRRTTIADQVALFTFDAGIRRLVSFEDWNAAPAGERAALALQRLEAVAPGWAATHLGNALVGAAEVLEESVTGQVQSPDPERRQIVLISDLQEGSRLDRLQAYEWPKGIELSLEPVNPRRASNAGLQLVTDRDEIEKTAVDPGPRARISNAADSRQEQFEVGWSRAGQGAFDGAPVSAYVPAGQSRILPLPQPPAGVAAGKVVLRGDDEPFDNEVFIAPTEPARVSVAYVGPESAEDHAQPLFYLNRAFQQSRRQVVQVVARPPGAAWAPAELERTPLLIVSGVLPPEQTRTVRAWLNDGKSGLVVLNQAGLAATVAGLLGLDQLPCEDAAPGGYRLLGEIDFQHPLFAPFADPRFSDFAKVNFWKHRRLSPEAIPHARVLARFDQGDPALLQVPVGKGTLYLLTSGWHPADSQLALSSKFVPLLYSLLDLAGGVRPPLQQYWVGETVTLPRELQQAAGPLTVRAPGGGQTTLNPKDSFSRTEAPGLYVVGGGATNWQFAVNLDPLESKTVAMSADELERLGVPLHRLERETRELTAEKRRHVEAAELESQQRLWRWLIVAALVFVGLETWLAGRLSRPATVSA